MDFVELIATLLGILFYWWLNNSGREEPSRRRRTASPEEIPPPIPQPAQAEIPPVERKERKYINPQNTKQQETVGDIIRRLQAKAYESQSQEQTYLSYEKFFDERTGVPLSLISEKDIAVDDRKIISRTSPERMRRLVSMLQNPKTLQDAFILKEVFDRKWD